MLRTNTTVFLNSPFGKTVFYHYSKLGENTSYFWRWVLKLPRFSKCWFQPLSYINVRMLFFLIPVDGKCSKQLSYQISEHYRLAFLINFLSMDLMNCMLTILPVHQPVVTTSNAVSMYHMMTVHLLLFTCSTIFDIYTIFQQLSFSENVCFVCKVSEYVHFVKRRKHTIPLHPSVSRVWVFHPSPENDITW